ncbi:beta-1,6-N-acetylglucosaminyltransferase [Bifidobacterium biavatii]|uniref:Peptide O-xylosyltransferase n=1 Tax=Bifidobacterium biavatii DSM 23969 TaxID=1437608 RepID=A0A086ZYJ4_9BIFI|nr:beta-1,6-N-acetylglucosaminyltransferase [Bifidobacterium biavatii]KFI51594.1 glycosyltransferase, family 14 [Bifidobacterium biavatii DSM 23969]
MINDNTGQSLVISAYKDKKNLDRLVNRLGERYNMFIHVDSSSSVLSDDDVAKWNGMPNVYAEKRYAISWGSYKHLLALLGLLRRAVASTVDGGYIHLISGQDIPVRSNDEFDAFFAGDTHVYMDCRTIDQMEPHQKRMYQLKNRLWRFNYWNKIVHALRNVDLTLQKSLHIVNDRFGDESNLAQGLVWLSLPKEAARYVLDYVDAHPKFMKDLYQAQIPEEFLFQTILVNSPFSDRIVPNHLRYMDWNRRNGSLPAYLDESDYDKITSSDCFFARKIDSTIAEGLLKRLGYDPS